MRCSKSRPVHTRKIRAGLQPVCNLIRRNKTVVVLVQVQNGLIEVISISLAPETPLNFLKQVFGSTCSKFILRNSALATCKETMQHVVSRPVALSVEVTHPLKTAVTMASTQSVLRRFIRVFRQT